MQQGLMQRDSRVAIVGGGIGGMTLANALQSHGWEGIQVFEQWEKVKTRGGHISIMPASQGGALHVLEALGLHEKVSAVAPSTARSLEARSNGCLLSKQNFPIGGPRIMREALQQILLDNLQPGTVRFGMELHSFQEHDDRVELHFKDGSSEVFDLVVAADGINSTIAAQLFPGTGSDFTGYVYYCCLARGAFMPDDTFVDYHYDCGDSGFTLRGTSGSGFDGRWDLAAFAVRAATPVSNSWDAEGTKEQVQTLLDAMEKHGGCPEWAKEIVANSERVMRWGIYESAPKPSWASPGGRVVLLGDAAHAMAPFLGMGAQSAMLDAHALAAELLRDQPLADALAAYQVQRKGPCEQIMSRAKMAGMVITSFGATSAYRKFADPCARKVHLGLLTSSKSYLRSAGLFLMRLLELGYQASEQLNALLHGRERL